MWTDKTDAFILREIGAKSRGKRLSMNMTQKELAERSGVGVTSVQRLERGLPVSTKNLVAIKRAMRSLEQLKQGFPDKEISPLQIMRLEGRTKQRARKKEL